MGIDQILGIIASLVTIGAGFAAAFIYFQKDNDTRDRRVIIGVAIAIVAVVLRLSFSRVLHQEIR